MREGHEEVTESGGSPNKFKIEELVCRCSPPRGEVSQRKKKKAVLGRIRRLEEHILKQVDFRETARAVVRTGDSTKNKRD